MSVAPRAGGRRGRAAVAVLLFVLAAGGVLAWYFLFRPAPDSESRFADLLAYVPAETLSLVVVDVAALRASPQGGWLENGWKALQDALPPDVQTALSQSGVLPTELEQLALAVSDPLAFLEGRAGSWSVVCSGHFDHPKVAAAAQGLLGGQLEREGVADLVLGPDLGLAIVGTEIVVVGPAATLRARVSDPKSSPLAAIPAALEPHVDRSAAVWGGSAIPGSLRLPLPGMEATGVTHSAGSLRLRDGVEIEGGLMCTDPGAAVTLRRLAENAISVVSLQSLLGSPGPLERFLLSVKLRSDGSVLAGTARLDAITVDEMLGQLVP